MAVIKEYVVFQFNFKPQGHAVNLEFILDKACRVKVMTTVNVQ